MAMARAVNADQSWSSSELSPELVSITRDMLEEFLMNVVKQNEDNLSTLSPHAGCFKKLRLIEFVFYVCDQFCLHHQIRYQAVELLDRFMIQYIEKLHSSRCSNSNNDAEQLDWMLTQTTVHGRFVLRILSCVQIASKLSFHYQVVNNIMIFEFLQSLGYFYKKADLLDSELLVLKTLNFQVNVPSPLTHTELLIVVMGYNNPSVPLKRLHSVSLRVLSYAYLKRNTIYESLLKTTVQNSTPTEFQRANFLPTMEDCILLAVGVIGASAFMLNYSPWLKVIQQLASISGVTEEGIFEFAQIILQVLRST